MSAIIWVMTGLAVGAFHALSIWKAVDRPADGGPSLLRMTVTAVLLVMAALAGAILPAALGWGIGMAEGVLFLWTRRRAP